MRPLSEATARVTGKSFTRKYIALGRIVSNWTEIVGEKMSTKAQPVKIHYRKSKDKNNKKPVASLDIAVDSATGTVLHYQKDLILERINQIFGDAWISAIRFVPVSSNTNKSPIKKRKSPLTVQEKDSLSNMLDDIKDEDIKERLKRLGEGVLSYEKL